MLTRPSFKKSLIVEQFQRNYLKGFPLILIPIALILLGLGTKIDSRAKAPPAKRSKKGHGDENGFHCIPKSNLLNFFHPATALCSCTEVSPNRASIADSLQHSDKNRKDKTMKTDTLEPPLTSNSV